MPRASLCANVLETADPVVITSRASWVSVTMLNMSVKKSGSASSREGTASAVRESAHAGVPERATSPERPKRRAFTAEYKLRIVREADAALASGVEGAIGELLRRRRNCTHRTSSSGGACGRAASSPGSPHRSAGESRARIRSRTSSRSGSARTSGSRPSSRRRSPSSTSQKSCGPARQHGFARTAERRAKSGR